MDRALPWGYLPGRCVHTINTNTAHLFASADVCLMLCSCWVHLPLFGPPRPPGRTLLPAPRLGVEMRIRDSFACCRAVHTIEDQTVGAAFCR